MRSARDGSPDVNPPSSSARRPVQKRIRPRPPSGIVPATPSRTPGAFSKSDARVSPLFPAPAGAPSLSRQPKLLDRLRDALRARHYSPRTEQSYRHWVKRFIFFHHVRHPTEMAEPEINAFLTHLAVREKVSASTQNQALSALLFLDPSCPRPTDRGPGGHRSGLETEAAPRRAHPRGSDGRPREPDR